MSLLSLLLGKRGVVRRCQSDNVSGVSSLLRRSRHAARDGNPSKIMPLGAIRRADACYLNLAPAGLKPLQPQRDVVTSGGVTRVALSAMREDNGGCRPRGSFFNPRRPAMSTMQTPSAPHGSLAPGASLVHALARNWWLLVLRGVVAIVFGVLAFVWPGITLVTLVLFYGAFVLIDGVLAIAAAIHGGNMAPRWWLAIVGIAGIGAGVLTFAWPGITALVLLLFIAFWAIVLGVFEIIGAIRLRKEIEGEWLLILNGALSIAFGLVLLWRPGLGALAVVWIIGAYAIIFGVTFVLLGLKLRQHAAA
jgi:uncharacterized membrane protein HdeD (DUF308 family)